MLINVAYRRERTNLRLQPYPPRRTKYVATDALTPNISEEILLGGQRANRGHTGRVWTVLDQLGEGVSAQVVVAKGETW